MDFRRKTWQRNFRFLGKPYHAGKWNSSYIMSVGGIAIFTLIGIDLWVAYQNVTSVIISAVGDLLVTMFHELFLGKYTKVTISYGRRNLCVAPYGL
jgi:hypothetical protein